MKKLFPFNYLRWIMWTKDAEEDGWREWVIMWWEWGGGGLGGSWGSCCCLLLFTLLFDNSWICGGLLRCCCCCWFCCCNRCCCCWPAEIMQVILSRDGLLVFAVKKSPSPNEGAVDRLVENLLICHDNTNPMIINTKKAPVRMDAVLVLISFMGREDKISGQTCERIQMNTFPIIRAKMTME